MKSQVSEDLEDRMKKFVCESIDSLESTIEMRLHDIMQEATQATAMCEKLSVFYHKKKRDNSNQ